MEGAGTELNAEDLTPAFQPPCEFARCQAVDPRILRLDHGVDAGIGQRVLAERLRQIPVDDPVARDKPGQIGCGQRIGDLELAIDRLGFEDAAMLILRFVIAFSLAQKFASVAFLQDGRSTFC